VALGMSGDASAAARARARLASVEPYISSLATGPARAHARWIARRIVDPPGPPRPIRRAYVSRELARDIQRIVQQILEEERILIGAISQHMQGLLAQLDDRMARAGLRRRRSGKMGGTDWIEAAGHAHGSRSYLELRIHLRPAQQLVQAGLVAYRPLAEGGKTDLLAEVEEPYVDDPNPALRLVEQQVAEWLEPYIQKGHAS
jgi:hypothetical protein